MLNHKGNRLNLQLNFLILMDWVFILLDGDLSTKDTFVNEATRV